MTVGARISILVVILLLLGGAYVVVQQQSATASKTSETAPSQNQQDQPSEEPMPDLTGPKNGTYTIEGKRVTLINGVSEETVAGSEAKIVTRYLGNEAAGDLNGDGVEDVAFVLTQERGGSGVFFYAVVALKTTTGYTGTNGLLLGDRIAPQTSEIIDEQLAMNYAERQPGEAMTVQPSVGVTDYFTVRNGTLRAH